MNRLILFFVLISSFSFAQKDSIQTFKISKIEVRLYQGVDTNIQDWFLFIDENDFVYMANLQLPIEEIKDWFIKRLDSDNIYKSTSKLEDNNRLILIKKNEPEAYLDFRVSKENKLLILESNQFIEKFIFIRINIQ